MERPSRAVRIGLIGLGTVGAAVWALIERHRDEYLRALGVDLRVARVCNRHPERAGALGIDPAIATDDWRDVTDDSDIDIIVELIGDERPAGEIFETAIASGKHVVSANKKLLGHRVEDLARRAACAGVQIRCEAAVCGGIPIVEALEHALIGNEILTVAGIMNGTTNYILSRMAAEAIDFAEALERAQRLGYAEADPTADIDGTDAASKLAILSSIAFHSRVSAQDVLTSGIRGISAEDIAAAHELGMVIKLLGVARSTDRGIEARVRPVMISAAHGLARLDGAANAVVVVGDAVGETVLIGQGAGAAPTASAVVGDILEIARPIARGLKPIPEPEPFSRVAPVRSPDERIAGFCARIIALDRPNALVALTLALSERGVSIERIRWLPAEREERCQIVLVTRPVIERTARGALIALESLGDVEQVASIIPVEDADAWHDDSARGGTAG